MNNYKKIYLLACFILLGWAKISFAEYVSSYQIEMIVFSHPTNQNLKSEQWPLVDKLKLPFSSTELHRDKILPSSQWRLKQVHQQLQKNHYPILMHLAWQQSTTEAQKEEIIHLQGGATVSSGKQMDGTLAISLQHYFNLHFNLQFLMPSPSDTPFYANLNQELRMRSNELNYIDHPFYGVIIEIFPTVPSVIDSPNEKI